MLVWHYIFDLKVPQQSVHFIAEISLIRVELCLYSGNLAQIVQDENDKCAPGITHLLLGTLTFLRLTVKLPSSLFSGLVSVQLLHSNIVSTVTCNTQKDWQALIQCSNYCPGHLDTKPFGLGHKKKSQI